jgi:hypothetical protein
MRRLFSLALLIAPSALLAVELKSSDGARREFAFDGRVWRTSAFVDPAGKVLPVASEEFQVRTLDDREWTVNDYRSAGEPEKGERTLVFRYVWPDDVKRPDEAPVRVTVSFESSQVIRKRVELEFSRDATVDRLEVERFTTAEPAARGGRGEPVWVGDRWFFGLEHPAGHSRHSNGNTPKPDAHHYEMVGNYSYVDLEGRDTEARPRPGMLRLFHFPGFAKKEGGRRVVRSQRAIAGVAAAGEPVERGFLS